MPSESTAIQARTVLKQDVQPSNEDVLWIDTSGTNNAVKFYNGSKWEKVKPQSGPNPFDAAETFLESDVSLSGSGAAPNNGAVKIAGPIGGASGPGDDNGGSSRTDAFGLRVSPNQDLWGLQAKVSSDSGGFSRTILYDGSEILAEVSGSFSSGDLVDIPYPVKSGTTYYVLAYNDGNSYQHGHDTGTSFPVTSSVIDITEGVSVADPDAADSPSTTGNRAQFVAVEGLEDDGSTSGQINVAWPNPGDIFEWDTATFQATDDGETVDVYVAYDDGTGWTRTNGGNPVSRNYSLGDDSNISADDEVRIEAELSRSDTSNVPRLDAAYRSWLV